MTAQDRPVSARVVAVGTRLRAGSVPIQAALPGPVAGARRQVTYTVETREVMRGPVGVTAVSTLYVSCGTGPMCTFSEAVSFQIFCKDQAEVDHYFDALVAGGEPSYCGWLKDKFGLSWQIVPTAVLDLVKNPETGQRAFAEINKPEKIDIAAVQAACA